MIESAEENEIAGNESRKRDTEICSERKRNCECKKKKKQAFRRVKTLFGKEPFLVAGKEGYVHCGKKPANIILWIQRPFLLCLRTCT